MTWIFIKNVVSLLKQVIIKIIILQTLKIKSLIFYHEHYSNFKWLQKR
jgi:hypothetical protein